jgi:DsbC/DsbD-like thiol-disulfide interchange protein
MTARLGRAMQQAVLLMTIGIAAPSLAGGPVHLPQATVALHAGWQEADGTRIAGLEIDLADGWKTYWRAPGAGGLPPMFDWSASTNVAAVVVEWPAPMVFESYGVTSIGYSDTVVLPLKVTPLDAAEPVTLGLTLDFGVCADICVPARAVLDTVLAPGAEGGTASVAAHRARVPRDARHHGVQEAACGVRGAGDTRNFEARLHFDKMPSIDPVVLVEGPDSAWFGPVTLAWSGAIAHAEGAVEVYGDGTWIARDALRMTLIWPDHALDVQGCTPL